MIHFVKFTEAQEMSRENSLTRNIGAMAESQLELWASQVGITWNKANMDLEGWDYFLQFPLTNFDNHETADRVPPRIECLVQVKGYGIPKTKKGIKLSNLQKLVLDPLPVFFLFLGYSNSNDIVAAHLVHLDESLITRVLKKLRNARKDSIKKLNERYVYLTWTGKHLLQSFDGQGLEAAIQQHIGGDMPKYYSWKLKVRETAGDPIPSILRSTFQFGSNEQGWLELVDFAIGIQESLPTTQTTLQEDVRFNIARKEKELGEGILKFTPPNIECDLLFHNKDRSIEVGFPAKLYTPRWFFADTEIPQEYEKYRATFELGQVIFMPGLGQAKFNIDFPAYERELNLEELYNCWQLVELFGQNETILITLTALVDTKEYVIPVQAFIDDTSFINNIDILVWEIVDSMRWLTRVLPLTGDITLSISQLMSQRDTIQWLRMIYDRSQPITSLTVDIPEEQLEQVLKKELTIPLVRTLRLGDRSILVTAVIAGLPSLTGASNTGYKQIELSSARIIILEHQKYAPENEKSTELILEELEKRLDSDGHNYLLVE